MTSTTTDTSATIVISQDPSIVTVIERFEVPDDRKDEAIATARAAIDQAWMKDPLFVAAALLRGREHDGISCYSQWHRTKDRLTPEAPPASWSLASALPMIKFLEARTFSMDFIEGTDAGASRSEISMETTPHLHYGLFAVKPEDQNRVVDLGRINSTQSIGATGLLSINWHRSLDAERVVNLGIWTSFEGLEELNRQEGFKPGEVYWDGYADWSGELFDVVAIERSLQS